MDGEPSVASVEGSSGCVKGSRRTEVDVSEHCGGILLSSMPISIDKPNIDFDRVFHLRWMSYRVSSVY